MEQKASQLSTTTAGAKKLSKIGQWRRKHPRGLDGVVINDRRILDGLSPFDPDYRLPK